MRDAAGYWDIKGRSEERVLHAVMVANPTLKGWSSERSTDPLFCASSVAVGRSHDEVS
jgi:hypothetical protein